MRTVLLSIILVLIPFFLVEGVFAAPTTVIVTEKVPGASCTCKASCNPGDPIEKRKYECTVDTGLAGFQNMFATIIRWFVNIVMLF
ncbi:MAG: hypothetical protein WAW59_07545 [Patescibacteria group bacterium]